MLRCAAFALLVALPGHTLAADAGEERLRRLMEQARQRAGAPGAARSALTESQGGERASLLALGEGALARGDVDEALQAFERAAAILHSADTEMGLVRAYMQGGEYRRALAFVAHTAVAHREVAGGAALYAWLLHMGGQGTHSDRLLARARERFGADPLLEAVQRELRSGAPLAHGAMLEAPARLAPYDVAAYPAGARVAGSALLLEGGRTAVAPLATVAGASRIWVRNGVGQASKASVEKRDAGSQLALLRLDHALPLEAGPGFATGDPFPGSVAFAVEYISSRDAQPRWPILHSGFLGRATPDGRRRDLGLALPPGPRGGPVFDQQGRIVGLALPGGQLLPVTRLRRALGEKAAAVSGGPPATRAAADQIYESALRSTLQVIATR